jgi:hypothetical protein
MNKRFPLFEKILICFSFLLLLVQEVNAQTLTKKQQDSAFLLHPGQERLLKIKKSIAKTFIDFVGNEVSLYGSLEFSKQNINDNAITAPINYLYNNVNSNTYNSGYSGGFRIDGIYKEKHRYALSFGLNRIAAGSNYKNIHTLSPFIEDFTHFKADNVFTTISIAAHYKKLLPVNDMNKYKFYAVVGPSFDYKISKISDAQLINGAGNRAFINLDLGAEFDNKGYYILYGHYKLGNYVSSSTVPVQLNRFEIGMSIKTKDLF